LQLVWSPSDIVCSVPELQGWQIVLRPEKIRKGRYTRLHLDASGMRVCVDRSLSAPVYRISVPDEASAAIDWQRKEIRILTQVKGMRNADLGQFVDDHIAPRILSRLWPLVLHSGIVTCAGGCALLAGASGHGKSTLTAFLHRSGWQMLGDDAALLEFKKGVMHAHASYRRLSLLPDSLENVLGDPCEDGADRTTKRRVTFADAPQQAASHPVAAIFVLAAPSDAAGITLRPLYGTEACMGLLGNSFSFDPTDAAESMNRLAGASRVAQSVPIYEIDYPRDYAALPELRDILAAALTATVAERKPF
jgi:hypothetical protein